MKKINLLLICLSALFCVSCATTYRFVPFQNDSSIEIVTERGEDYPVYEDDEIAVAVSPAIVNDDLCLSIAVINYEDEKLHIEDKDFTCYYSHDKNNWEKTDVILCDDYYEREHDSYVKKTVFLGILEAVDIISSSYDTVTTTTTYRTPHGNHTYVSTTTFYDPIGAGLATDRAIRDISAVSRDSKEWLNYLKENMFYSTDIRTNENYLGLVFADFHDNQDFLKVTLTLEDKEISFIYSVEEE